MLKTTLQNSRDFILFLHLRYSAIKTKECLLPEQLKNKEDDKEDDFPRIIKFTTPTRLLIFTNKG